MGFLLRVLGLAAVAIGAVSYSRRRRVPIAEVCALRKPTLGQMARWVVVFAFAGAVAEVVGRWMGADPVTKWEFTPAQAALRAVANIVVAPATEEFFFRGILFDLVSRSRLPRWTVIPITSAAFAAAHFQYAGIMLLFVFVDGCLLGAARARTRSIFVPMVMHAAGNAFAVWQRVS